MYLCMCVIVIVILHQYYLEISELYVDIVLDIAR
jgi:hypothetical protein